MDTNKKIESPYAIVDRALFLLRRHMAYKKEVDVLKALEKKGINIRQTDLTRTKTLSLHKDRYLKRGNDFVSEEKASAIAKALIALLGEETGIIFENGYFKDPAQGTTWGVLAADPQPAVENEHLDLRSSFLPKEYLTIYEKIKYSQKVRILHTYINATETFAQNCEWAIQQNDCHFQVMLLEPFSDALRLRIKGLSESREPGENIESKSKENFRFLKKLQEKYPNNFHFLAYDELPGIAMYHIDNMMYMGIQWFQKLSYQGRFHEATFAPEKSPLHANADDHFKKLWEKYSNPTWSHKFWCYLLRDGQLLKVCLKINLPTLEVMMSHTPSKINFQGHMTEHDDGTSSLHLHTCYESLWRGEYVVGDKRTANFMLHLNSRTIMDDQSIFVGIYSVDTRHHHLRANVVVLVPLKETSLSVAQETIIKSFLEAPHTIGDTSEIAVPGIYSWDILAKFRRVSKKNTKAQKTSKA